MSRQRRKLIYLLGFMGSGKSTVGKLLATKLGWPFIDLDTVIEAGQGLSIRAIFENSGEVFFRQLERAALTETSKSEPAVIALGGERSRSRPTWTSFGRRAALRFGSTARRKFYGRVAKAWTIVRSSVTPSHSAASSWTACLITDSLTSASPPRG